MTAHMHRPSQPKLVFVDGLAQAYQVESLM